jgi:hypothetical protein
MVLQNDFGYRPGKADIFENIEANDGMLFNQAKLQGRQTPGLRENFRWDADFSQIMYGCREMQSMNTISG